MSRTMVAITVLLGAPVLWLGVIALVDFALEARRRARRRRAIGRELDLAPHLPICGTTTTMVHRGCGQVAFHTLDYRPGEYAHARDILMPDGSMPRPGDRVRCGSCGEDVTLSLADLEARA